MPLIKDIFILAKNYQHFNYFCNSVKLNPRLSNVHYLSQPDQLWGRYYGDCIFLFYETWQEHPNSQALYHDIQVMELMSKPVPISVRRPVVNPNDNFWYRLTKLDPAVFRGLIVAIVALLASVGVAISPGVPDALIGFIWAVSALVQAAWTRQAVTANAKVAVVVPDPVNNPQIIEAGEAIATAPPAAIVEAATANPKP